MGFIQQGEGLLQDGPAGTGTRILSGVPPPPNLFLCPSLEGSPFFIPYLPAPRGFCSRPWKTGKCPLVRPAVARERSRGSWNEREPSGWGRGSQGGHSRIRAVGSAPERGGVPSTPES